MSSNTRSVPDLKITKKDRLFFCWPAPAARQ